MEAPFLSDARVEGKYMPSVGELHGILAKIDLKEKFKNVKLEQEPESDISLSFDSIADSHLFVLTLISKGFDEELFQMTPDSTFFTNIPLDDYRVDGGDLSYDEENGGGRTISRLSIVNKDITGLEKMERYTKMVRDVIGVTGTP